MEEIVFIINRSIHYNSKCRTNNMITLSVYNQDDELIPNFSDYILLLQFIRHKTEEGVVIGRGLTTVNFFFRLRLQKICPRHNPTTTCKVLTMV